MKDKRVIFQFPFMTVNSGQFGLRY